MLSSVPLVGLAVALVLLRDDHVREQLEEKDERTTRASEPAPANAAAADGGVAPPELPAGERSALRASPAAASPAAASPAAAASTDAVMTMR